MDPIRSFVVRIYRSGRGGLHATTQYREGDQLIDVVTRLEGAERTDLDNIKDAKLYTRDGKFVALSQVARIQLGSEQSVVWRRNRMNERHFPDR